jgi:ABC-type transport system involved in multi-copper enzyme maturation permease subunit
MFSMIHADLLKVQKRAIGWIMLTISFLLVTLIMLLMSMQSGTASEQLSSFPGGLLTGPQIIAESLGTFLVIIFSASLVGSEYHYATWKNLLTRYPGRVAFILSKWVTLAIAIGAGVTLLALWSQLLNWLLGAGRTQTMGLGAVLLELLVHALILLGSGTVTLLGVVGFRSIFAGMITGITWLVLDSIAGAVTFVPNAVKRYLFSPAGNGLLAYIRGSTRDVDMAWTLLTISMYLILPITLAAYIFHQRDVTG